MYYHIRLENIIENEKSRVFVDNNEIIKNYYESEYLYNDATFKEVIPFNDIIGDGYMVVFEEFYTTLSKEEYLTIIREAKIKHINGV